MYTFFEDFSIVIMVAAAVVMVFNYFKLPASVGYILAGLIIGPHVPPMLIVDQDNIQMLSDMGVMFLMFAIGLGFSFRELKRVGLAVLVPALLDVIVTTWAGYQLGLLLGWGQLESILLGLIICDSSTTILAKTLDEAGLSKQHFAKTLFSITLIEDILAIIIIAMLSGFTPNTATMDSGAVLGRTGILLIFLASVIVVGLLVVPPLLSRIARHRNDELLLMVVLGLCCGVSLIAVKLELSLALGAFLIGAIVSESRAINRIEELVMPLRQLFSSIFFISMGLLINPYEIWLKLPVILAVTATMAGAKILNGTVGCLIIGEKPRDALRIGLGLAQVAEFAFIIATLGIKLTGDQSLFQIAVGVAILSTAVNPLLLKSADPIARAFNRLAGPRPAEWCDAYGKWLQRIGAPQSGRTAFNKARRALLFLLLNMLLIAGIFLSARYLRTIPLLARWLEDIHFSPLLWILAALTASPLYAASFRYLHLFAKNLSESFLENTPSAMPIVRNFRQMLHHVFLLIGVAGIALATFIVSKDLLPSWREQLILMSLMVLLIVFRWRRLNHAYATAQTTLQDLFRRESPRNEMRSMLSIHMRSVELPADAPSINHSIIDLNIRARAGASVISIRRGEDYTVNPALTEPFQRGDTVLLLGNTTELDTAETLLTGQPPQDENF